MSIYTIKKYDTLDSFLAETESTLSTEELRNSFILTMAEDQKNQEIQAGHQVGPFYYGTVWNQQSQLVFALCLFSKTMLYGSSLLGNDLEPVDLLVQDFVSYDLHRVITIVHAFQPVLGRLHSQLKEKTQLNTDIVDKTWAYDLTTVVWPSLAKQIAQAPHTELRLATEKDLPLLIEWIKGFWDAISDNFDTSIFPSPEQVCQDPLKNRFIYILYLDGVPVNMAWKRRPLKKGISIAYVYTPKEHRRKGYAAACVALLTEELLKSYEYVNLFALGSQNPEMNLYTTLGYRWCGEAARLVILP
jgi:predicted GNAT family acetyltransferase